MLNKLWNINRAKVASHYCTASTLFNFSEKIFKTVQKNAALF